MTQEVVIDDKKILLESDIYYTGDNDLDEKEKGIRKALRLPVTKNLVYYRNKHEQSSAVFVSKYKIIEMYDISYPWYTLEICLADDGSTVRIHHLFFSEMQKPSFIEDMKKQEQSGSAE